MYRQSSQSTISHQDAEEIAIRILSFLAGEADRISRFMALSGMEPGEIAENAASSSFQAALLDYLMNDEALLLTFCSNENIAPELIAPAHHILSNS
jgi:hypothetical protein